MAVVKAPCGLAPLGSACRGEAFLSLLESTAFGNLTAQLALDRHLVEHVGRLVTSEDS